MTRHGRIRVSWLVCLPPATLLLVSSLTHLNNNYQFLSTVYSYQLVGRWSGAVIAALLPYLLLTVGLALLFPNPLRSAAVTWSAILYFLFLVVQVTTLARGLNIACGCFGTSDANPIGARSIGIAAGGLILSAAGLVFDRMAGKQANMQLHPAAAGVTGELKPCSVSPDPAAPRREGFTLLESLVAIAIIAILTGLLLSAVQRARDSAARTQCQNNLKQIGLALHNYHDARRALPPGCSDENWQDPYLHVSWLTRILPYVEQGALWQQATAAFQQQSFFLTPPHFPILGHPIPLYHCPSNPYGSPDSQVGLIHIAFTSYLGVSGTNCKAADGVLFLNSSVSLLGITDGTSQTIAAGERPRSWDENYGWWYAGWGQSKDGSADTHLGTREINVDPRYASCPPGPYHFAPGEVRNQCDAFHYWSGHSGGANYLFADGSVRFLRYSADPVMPALATRAGGEPVPALD